MLMMIVLAYAGLVFIPIAVLGTLWERYEHKKGKCPPGSCSYCIAEEWKRLLKAAKIKRDCGRDLTVTEALAMKMFGSPQKSKMRTAIHESDNR